MPTPIEIYCGCMEDLKRRMALIESIINEGSILGTEDLDAELVCLHLRKILELIAFATLSAHKDAYARAYDDFATHWNAKRLLAKLEKLHPQFYPKPVMFSAPDKDGVKHFADVKDGFLTRSELPLLYDLCGSAMHVRNPFLAGKHVLEFQRPIAEWILRIKCLLNVHWIRLIGTADVWLVQMHQPDDGKVHAYYGSDVPSNTKNS